MRYYGQLRGTGGGCSHQKRHGPRDLIPMMCFIKCMAIITAAISKTTS